MTDIFDPASSQATEPTGFVAGDLVMWRRTDDLTTQYLGGMYALSYAFRPAAGGPNAITVEAVDNATEWRASLTAAVTAGMVAGRWYWSAYLTRISDSQRIQIDDGQVVVEANRVVDPSDTRSHARRVLDSIEAAIEGRAGDTVQSYTIGGRQINKMSADELIKWRSYYLSQIAAENDAERLANGLPAQNTIRVRFTE